MKKNDRLWLLVVVTVLCVILQYIPYGTWISYPFTLCFTIFHELGHGFTAVLLGGKILGITVHPDASGLCESAGDFGRISWSLVAVGGLVGPAIVALFLGGLSRYPQASRLALGVLSLLSLYFAVLKSETLFTSAVFIALALVLLGACTLSYPWVWPLTLMVLAVQMGLATFSRSDYLFVSRTSSGELSDVALIAENLWLPYWFWGGLCGLLSLVFLALSVKVYLSGEDGREENN